MEININKDIITRLKEYHKNTSFKNFDELVAFILSDFLDKNKIQQDGSDEKSGKQTLNERLKNLGYL